MEKAASLSMRPSLSDSPQFSHSLVSRGFQGVESMKRVQGEDALDAPILSQSTHQARRGARKRPGPPLSNDGPGLAITAGWLGASWPRELLSPDRRGWRNRRPGDLPRRTRARGASWATNQHVWFGAPGEVTYCSFFDFVASKGFA